MKTKQRIFAALFATAILGACTPTREGIIPKLDEKMADPSNPLVLMKTSMGDMVIELYAKAAPKTVENFLGLSSGTKTFMDPATNQQVKKPFYDGLTFHRVIDGFMIQGGDINGNGSGGPGYQFEDEISAEALGLTKLMMKDAPQYERDKQMAVYKKLGIMNQETFEKKKAQITKALADYDKKTVAEVMTEAGYQYHNELPSVGNDKFTLSMANRGPNTNGSQFFINVANNAGLNGKHTVFGKVVKGQNIAQEIAKVKKDPRDKPENPVIIKKIIELK